MPVFDYDTAWFSVYRDFTRNLILRVIFSRILI